MSRLNPMTPRAVVLVLFASVGALGAWPPTLQDLQPRSPALERWLAPSRARCQPPIADFAHCSDRWMGSGGDATQQKPVAAPADAQERSRLLELQRTAGAQLQQARRDGATADQIKKALLDASSSLAHWEKPTSIRPCARSSGAPRPISRRWPPAIFRTSRRQRRRFWRFSRE